MSYILHNPIHCHLLKPPPFFPVRFSNRLTFFDIFFDIDIRSYCSPFLWISFLIFLFFHYFHSIYSDALGTVLTSKDIKQKQNKNEKNVRTTMELGAVSEDQSWWMDVRKDGVLVQHHLLNSCLFLFWSDVVILVESDLSSVRKPNVLSEKERFLRYCPGSNNERTTKHFFVYQPVKQMICQ